MKLLALRVPTSPLHRHLNLRIILLWCEQADLLRFPSERALQAELPEPSSSSRKRRPSSTHSHSPLSPPHQQSPMDKRLKAEGTGSAGTHRIICCLFV
jgi:hypothetical protein